MNTTQKIIQVITLIVCLACLLLLYNSINLSDSLHSVLAEIKQTVHQSALLIFPENKDDLKKTNLTISPVSQDQDNVNTNNNLLDFSTPISTIEWDQPKVSITPSNLSSDGGQISVAIATKETNMKSSAITFSISGSDFFEKVMASEVSETDYDSYISKSWTGNFTIPANNTYSSCIYTITASSSLFSEVRTGSVTVKGQSPSVSWEQNTITITPTSLASNGGQISATISTNERGISASPISFNIDGSDLSQNQTASQITSLDLGNYISRTWQSSFTLPANKTSSSRVYTIKASSPQINDTCIGSITVAQKINDGGGGGGGGGSVTRSAHWNQTEVMITPSDLSFNGGQIEVSIETKEKNTVVEQVAFSATGPDFSQNKTANPGSVSDNGTYIIRKWQALFDLPANASSDEKIYTFTASSSKITGDATGSAIVAGKPLTIDTTSLPSGLCGLRYDQAFSASGGTAPYIWSLISGPLPDGLHLVDNTISGIPSVEDIFNFTIKLTDNSSETVAKSFSILISDGNKSWEQASIDVFPSILPSSGGDTSFVIATDEDPTKKQVMPITYRVSGPGVDQTLVAEETANADHKTYISRCWKSIFTFPKNDTSTNRIYTVTATSSQISGCPTGTVTVQGKNLTINTVSLVDGICGLQYSQTFSATGGAAPYNWAVDSGTLPAGLSLMGSTISGIPRTEGIYNFTVEVTDYYGDSATRDYSIEVTIGTFSDWDQTEVTITPTSLTVLGGQIEVSIATNENNIVMEPITFSINGPEFFQNRTGDQVSFTQHTNYITREWKTIFDLPANVDNNEKAYTIIASSSQITGNPTGIATVKGIAFTIDNTSLPGGLCGLLYNQALSASGGTAPYTWSIISGTLPNGLSLAGATISGVPNTTGTFNFTVRAIDNTGSTATQRFSIVMSTGTVCAWEQTGVDVNPLILPSTGGQISAVIATDENSAEVTPISFTLTGPEISLNVVATQVAEANHGTYISKAWKVYFTLPANPTTESRAYTVTAFSNQINGTPFGTVIVQPGQ